MHLTKSLPVVLLAAGAFAVGFFVFHSLGEDTQKPPDNVPPPPAPAQVAENADEKRENADAPPATQGPDGAYLMPANGGVWPWPVGRRPDPVAAAPVSLTHVVDREHTVHGAAVNPEAGRAIVALWETKSKQKIRGTHFLWCDLRAGAITHRWKINETLYAPFDLHADGRRFLMRNNSGVTRDRDVLELATITADEQLERRTWRPSATGGGVRQNDVHWAGFVGRDHIAAVSGGVLSVWRLDSLKQVGHYGNVSGIPAVTPDGERVAFITGSHVALLDPAAGRLLAECNLGSLPKDPVLAFHPEGTMLACGGAGRVVVLDLRERQCWNAMITELQLKTIGLLPDFGWVGDNHLYHNGSVYDLNMPIPVWSYVGAEWAAPRGRELWAVVKAFSDKQTALRSFRVPHATAQTRIAQSINQPGMFALRPGDTVSIDVAGVPAVRQAEVNVVLRRRVQQVGFQLAEQAPVVFRATVDTVATPQQITYHFGKKSVTCPYEQRQAHLKIVKDKKVLWSASASQQPPFLINVPNVADTQALVRERYGRPDYKLYHERPLPGVIRGDRVRGVIGLSDLAASGIRERY